MVGRYVREIVDRAPPLSPGQIVKLGALVAPAMAEMAKREAVTQKAWDTAHRKHRPGTQWVICPDRDSHQLPGYLQGEPYVSRKRRPKRTRKVAP
jgi:hypothetical protein